MPATSKMIQKDEIDDLGFKWGKKRLRGGIKKDVQFYDSFSLDGEEYWLYDSVYLFKDGESDPFIGKIIKIWELPNKAKKVKILWFFRPSEILNYLGDIQTLKNELFLGAGVGSGLDNVNPLFAIAGKCNVICISKDERNQEPSPEELNMADFVFYRTFNVGNFTISEELGEIISSIQVKLLLNKNKSQISNELSIESSRKGHRDNSVASGEKGIVLEKKDTCKTIEPDSNSGVVPVERTAAEYSLDTRKRPRVSNSDEAYAGKADPTDKNGVCGGNMAGLGSLDGQPSKKLKPDDCSRSTLKLAATSDTGKIKQLPKSAIISNEKSPHEHNKDSHDPSKVKNPAKSPDNFLDDRPSKKLKPAGPAGTSTQKAPYEHNKDSHGPSKVKSPPKSPDNFLDDRPSQKLKPAGPAGTSTQKLPYEHSKDSHGPSKVKSPPKSPDKFLDDRASKKLKSAGPAGSSTPSIAFDSSSCKIKAPLPNALAGDNNFKGGVKDSDGAKACVSQKMIVGEKIKKVPDDKSNVAPSKQIKKKDAKVFGRVVEVTRRPEVDSSKWFTDDSSWEEIMKTAQKEETLVLLQNLDPTYTSSEVEDIVWHGFHENCTAKVLPCVARPSLHSGQAFVIFKTKQAATRVLRELEDGCLMLSNGRPLLGRVGIAHFPGKSSSFPGHYSIDKLKFRMQRDKRDAVSTSHSSQPNTLEYDMAMEWRVLQERSEFMWKNVSKKHAEELNKLKGNLKRKF